MWRYETTARIVSGLAVGLAVFMLYRLGVAVIKEVVPFADQLAYPTIYLYGIPAVFLAPIFVIHSRRFGFSLIGTIKLGTAALLAGSVLLAYLSCVGVSLALGYGRELTMVLLGLGMTESQFMIHIAALFVFVPIVEEIIFRHFVLTALPYQRSDRLKVLAVVGSAALFMVMHFPVYDLWPTHVLMFILGIIFAVARVLSGGLLLPVMLHALAVGCALLLNYARAGWAG